MIVKNISTGSVIARTGTSVKTCYTGVGITTPDPVNNIDYCDYECSNEYYAFTFETESESDFFTVTQPIQLDTDAVTVTLQKGSTDYVLNDATYADIVENDNMDYYTVNWLRVYNSLGGGRYCIKLEYTSLGVTTTKIFGVFVVVPFDAKLANNTIAISGTLNGRLENYGDFKEDNISYFMRFTGSMTYQPVTTDERVLQGNRREVNSHKRKHNEYEIELDKIGFEFQQYLKDVYLMCDDISVKSYSILSPLYLKDISILVNEREVRESVGTRNLYYTLQAEDAVKNIIWHPA